MDCAVLTQLNKNAVNVFFSHFVPHHHKNIVLGNKASVLVHLLHYCVHHLLEVSTLLSYPRQGGTCMPLSTWLQLGICEDSLFANLLSNENLQQVVCHLVKLVNTLNMGAHDCLFLLEYSNRTVDFYIKDIPTKLKL